MPRSAATSISSRSSTSNSRTPTTAPREAASDAVKDIDDLAFEIEKHAAQTLVSDAREIIRLAKDSVSRYVVHARAGELKEEALKLKALIRVPLSYRAKKAVCSVVRKQTKPFTFPEEDILAALRKMREILSEAIAYEKPNFFAIGYYLTFEGETLPDMDIPSLNAHLRKVLDEKFMLEFIELAKEGLIYSHRRSLSKQKEALEVIARLKPVFEKAELDHAEVISAAKEIASAVEDAIDRLEIIKDNSAYTFRTSLREAIRQYYDGIERNKKEETRYARQMASYERKVARGKTPDYVVADKKLVDLDKAAKDIVSVLVRIEEDFKRRLAIGENVDFDERTVAMVDYLKQKASDVAYKVTRNMAKTRALKLLEEVGIPEPRKRYRQYPFEFSGGNSEIARRARRKPRHPHLR